MSARLMCTLIAVGCLGLLAVVLCLPPDFGFAAPVPTRLGSDLAVLPGDTALFITVRPADIVNDPLAKAFADQSGTFDGMDRGLGAGLASIERMTVANIGGEMVTIVRTAKAYDKSKLLDALPRPRFYGFKDKGFKDKDGAEPEKPRLIEKKLGTRTIHFYSNPEGPRGYGDPYRWTQAVGIVDRNVYVRGNLPGVEALLSSTVKPTAEMADLVALAGKHTIVAGFQGKQIRAALRNEARRYREERKRWSKDFDGKDDPPKEDKSKKEDKDDDSIELSDPAMVIFKPFLLMKSAVLTLDVGKEYQLNGRITFKDAEATDDGEIALKMTQYIFRELAVMLPATQRGFGPLAPLSEPVKKVFKEAKIKRKGNVLETSIRLTVEDGVMKKVREEVAAEKKRQEERMKKYKEREKRFFEKEKEKG